MPIEFLEDEAIADIAFKVNSSSLTELFREACETVFHLQTDTNLIEGKIKMQFKLTAKNNERLLYNVLSEILYFRDSEIFFGKTVELEISSFGEQVIATGYFIGEEFNPGRHVRWNDVKAITMHDFYLKEVNDGWESYILVDI